ncbi:MAG TPA: sigma 54-interacting transcriptional regulator [Candidatus Acidoferrales bacterium]|jgi:PAS domain S-box-containing protein|nr:sigma 54-interacting transcriptional regulator [Candidatus Acidoferrales bacterium]
MTDSTPASKGSSQPNPDWRESAKLLEIAHDAIIVRNPESHVLYWNHGAEETYGWTQQEALGQLTHTFLQTKFPVSLEAVDEQLARIGSWEGELLHTTRDGRRIVVLSRQVLRRDETGKPSAILEINRDITARKKIEEALQQSDQRFRLLVDNVRDYAIFMLDPEGRVANWNEGAERLKGYRAEEIVGRHFSRFYPPEDIGQGKPEHELQLAATEGRYEDEGWRLRKDGSRFWANVMITALRDAEGRLVGFSKITRDFTERRKAEEAVRLSEERFRSLFEFSPDAILVIDSAGKVTETNGQVAKFFGYTREELLGQTVECLVPERFRSTHPNHRGEYSAHPRTRQMGVGLELFGRRKDGTEFPVDIMLSPVETSAGKVVLSVIRDLSEKKQAEEEIERREREKRYLEEELNTVHNFEEIIGDSMGLKRVLKQVETVAATDVTVLILGETGTGKDLMARAIHNLSSRRNQTLVKLNCAAIPTGLLESELFGHEKGAFTGAISQKVGRVELAHQGTLFLDEVGDLPLELQPKLLRALQEKEIERLGGTRTIAVDVRLIAATNRNLEKLVADREFRSDLYYRLRVFPITIPPLRERREDIPLLVRYFVTKHSRRMNRGIQTIPADIMKALTRWDWPGNIRELANFIERAVILTNGPILRAPLAELQSPMISAPSTDVTLQSTEREHILRVLRETKGVIGGAQGAAARLGLKRTTLNSKLKKLDIQRDDYISSP